MRTTIAVILLIACLFGSLMAQEPEVDDPPSIDSAETVEVRDARYVVKIDRLKVTDGGVYDTLDIILDSYGSTVGGFDLKIAADSPFLEITEVLKGEIPDSCQWEFFNVRRITAGGVEGEPSTLWKITALAEFMTDSTEVPCYGFDRPASMVRLVVSSVHVDQVQDMSIPIFFYWQMCADNSVSGAEGNQMLVSKQVFDYYDVALESSPDIFPTRFGTPQQCINPSLVNGPVRAVEFHNGGVEFELDIREDVDSVSDSL
ncbi:MAG: hypothetical protein GY867_08040 [bacterium]|nr:hypothetical protein [bacterium]